MRGFMKIVAMIALGTIVLICGMNYRLNRVVQKNISEDLRNDGIDISVHYGSYLNRSQLVYDLKSVTTSNSQVDVFRVLFQTASVLQDRSFDEVILSCDGDSKFMLDGAYFSELGSGIWSAKCDVHLENLPEHVMYLSGASAYKQWSGVKAAG
ncbi:hypothetical protein OAT16_09800 [Prolixibacteraceae bacterium]|nr:hypothetical protein [Prolixibacteraceae bacterium]